MEDYAAYSVLDGLPALVRKQQQYVRKIAPIEPLIEKEKAVRKEIDLLLIQAKIAKGDGVTCIGFDVMHRSRVGQSSLNHEKVIAALVAEGVDEGLVLKVLLESVETGDPPFWAEVKPSKGAKVRA
jgi:hypothetical protein